MKETISKFPTIRQTAKTGILSEHRLRLMVAQGCCPGIYSGNRFLVNYDLLVEQLNRESMEQAQRYKNDTQAGATA